MNVLTDLERLQRLPTRERKAQFLEALPMDRKKVLLAEIKARKDRERYQNDPVAYIREVFGENLWSKQIEICEAIKNHRRVVISACHAPGKLAANYEPILTTRGWVPHGEIKVGDVAFSQYGNPTPVTAVVPQGKVPIYRVHFNDGTSLDVGLEHLWVAHTRYLKGENSICPACDEFFVPHGAGQVFCDRHRYALEGFKYCTDCLALRPVVDFTRRPSSPDGLVTSCRGCVKNRRQRGQGRRKPTQGDYWQVMTTKEIIEYGGMNPIGHRRARVPLPEPVDFPEASVPIDPYVLGVWLGDGDTNGGFTNIDDELIQYVGTRTQVNDHKCVKHWGLPGLAPGLRELGLKGRRCWEKFVPWTYLFNSREVRLEILRGLMDTDGTCDSNTLTTEFSSTSKDLAEGVRQLVLSLGGLASTPRSKEAWATWPDGSRHRGRDAWRTFITMPISPFRLSRKAKNWELISKARRRDISRLVERIEPIGEEEATCIMVEDSSGTYLTKDYLVTHNSHLAARLILWWGAVHPVSTTKILLTSSSFRQVRAGLFPVIRRLHEKYGLYGETNSTEWKVGKEILAFGFSAKDTEPETVQGEHSPNLLIIVDEAAGISQALGGAFVSLLTGGTAHIVLLGNPPVDNEGTWLESCANSPLWHSIKLSAFDTPNWTGEETEICKSCPSEVPEHRIAIHLIDKEFAQSIATEWGEDSPMYISKIKAEFPHGVANKVIPLSWVAASVEAAKTNKRRLGTTIRLGVDVASDGGDELAIARAIGNIVQMRHHSSGETNANAVDVAGKVLIEILEAEKLNDHYDNDEFVEVKIDAIGLGWGVVSQLERWGEEGLHHSKIVAVDVGKKAANPDKWLNARAEMWFNGRALLQPDEDDDMPSVLLDMSAEDAKQLSLPTYKTSTSGIAAIQKKSEMRAKGMGSPDRAEAILLALYQPVVEPPKRKARLLF